MKKLLTLLLIVGATANAQPSLSSFSLSQRTQLANYVTWATDPLKENIRLLQQQAKRDSINYVALKLQVDNLSKSTSKALADSMATLVPVSVVNNRIDSTVTQLNLYKVLNNKAVSDLQAALKLTDAQVEIIKAWIFRNFKF